MCILYYYYLYICTMSKSVENNEKTGESVVVAEQGLSGHLIKLSGLENLKPIASLSSEYLEMKEGDNKKFMFVQVSSIFSEDKGEDVPAIVLMDAAQNRFITAAKLIVETFITADGELLLAPYSCVEINFVEQVSLSGGRKYNKYKINLLG